MKTIKLTHGKFALVDENDYEKLSIYKWYYGTDGYAVRKPYDRVTGTNPHIFRMHRVILDAKRGQLIDHKNGNRLDNRKENLRFCTYIENGRNSKGRNSTSGFKGISWDKVNNKWKVQINPGKNINLGRFTSLDMAIRVYNENAIKYYGDFAYLNQTND